MILSKPLVPKHADSVLRVFCPKRPSTVRRNHAAVDADRTDVATWLGGVYAGPVAFCHYARRLRGGSDKPISGPVTILVNGPCDLVLVGEMRELTRSSEMLWKFIHNCLDNGVRLIAWREGIDTASDNWELPLHVAMLRMDLFCRTKRLKKGVPSSK